jgi:hypothetical protein
VESHEARAASWSPAFDAAVGAAFVSYSDVDRRFREQSGLRPALGVGPAMGMRVATGLDVRAGPRVRLGVRVEATVGDGILSVALATVVCWGS